MNNGKPTIGLILGNANSPHTNAMMKGVTAAAKDAGVNIVSFVGVHSSYFFREYFDDLKNEDYDYQNEAVYDYMRLAQLDAIVVSYGTIRIFMSQEDIDRLLTDYSRIPAVFLESTIENENARYIISDNKRGCKLVMDHLTKNMGYKRICHIAGPMGNDDADERRRAYLEGMEEIGVEVTDKMIVYGNFSESVENEVNELLDNNPNVEAIVCANDKTASACYKVLKKREVLYKKAEEENNTALMYRYSKHKVGAASEHSVAITGYDNEEFTENMDPPLTTVIQNSYALGYNGLMKAVRLMVDKDNTPSTVMPPTLVVRNSCGSQIGLRHEFAIINDYYRKHPREYADMIAKGFRDGICTSGTSRQFGQYIYDVFYALIYKHTLKYLSGSGIEVVSDEIYQDVVEILNGRFSDQISVALFISTFCDYMAGLIKNTNRYEGKDILLEAQTKITEYAYAKIITESRETVATYEHRTWFMPLISRDMVNNLDSEADMFESALNKIKAIDIGNVYLFVTKEPVKRKHSGNWKIPEELYLVGHSTDDKVSACSIDEAPVVTKNKLLNEYMVLDRTYNVSAIALCSGEYQYGMMVVEALPENVLSIYYAAVQISTALRYYDLAKAQKKMQAQLEHMVNEVEEKNEILRSLSEYDQLTGCLNRRGFLERGVKLIKENEGKVAIIFFADLDHLKEINDKFGHGEGDFAIDYVAKNLKEALGDNALLSRLGGDEFVAILIDVGEDDVQSYLEGIKETSDNFNRISAKPYYVECSTGYSVFKCSKNTDIDEIMNLADESLYEAKKQRRNTVVKTITMW